MDVSRKDEIAKIKSAEYFNKRKGARVLPPLEEGQNVRVRLPQDRMWKIPEKIVVRNSDTSYAIRNRRHLMPIPAEHDEKDEKEKDPVVVVDVAGGLGEEDVYENAKSVPTVCGTRTRYGRISKPVQRFGV